MIDPSTGQRLSAWRFGWSASKRISFSISCVEEFPSPDGLYLLVGLQNTTGSSGMVCLFDPMLSRVIKAIEFPMAVTTIECLTMSGGANVPHHSIRYFKPLNGSIPPVNDNLHVVFMMCQPMNT